MKLQNLVKIKVLQHKKNNLNKHDQASKSQSEVKKTKIIDLTQDNVDLDMERMSIIIKRTSIRN